jgi:hypothetical protein
MRGRSTVNFLAKTLLACSAKVVSSVRDRYDGISAAGRAVGPARHARTAKWILALFYFPTLLLDRLTIAQDLFLQATCATTRSDESVRGYR